MKGRASEVINILWVLKKKYNHLRELLKGKARAVFDPGGLFGRLVG